MTTQQQSSQRANKATYAGHYLLISFLLIFAIIIADQYSKWLIMETVLRVQGDAPGFLSWFFTAQPISYFIIERPEFQTIAAASNLNIVMVWNQGISFGLFDTNNPNMAFVFVTISMLISMSLIIWMSLANSLGVSISLAMIIGGAIGNVIDRIRFSAVVDFIDVHAAGYHWPAFNLADSCVFLGATCLIIHSLLYGETKTKKERK